MIVDNYSLEGSYDFDYIIKAQDIEVKFEEENVREARDFIHSLGLELEKIQNI